jgi:hypothetical protein
LSCRLGAKSSLKMQDTIAYNYAIKACFYVR